MYSNRRRKGSTPRQQPVTATRRVCSFPVDRPPIEHFADDPLRGRGREQHSSRQPDPVVAEPSRSADGTKAIDPIPSRPDRGLRSAIIPPRPTDKTESLRTLAGPASEILSGERTARRAHRAFSGRKLAGKTSAQACQAEAPTFQRNGGRKTRHGWRCRA